MTQQQFETLYGSTERFAFFQLVDGVYEYRTPEEVPHRVYTVNLSSEQVEIHSNLLNGTPECGNVDIDAFFAYNYTALPVWFNIGNLTAFAARNAAVAAALNLDVYTQAKLDKDGDHWFTIAGSDVQFCTLANARVVSEAETLRGISSQELYPLLPPEED